MDFDDIFMSRFAKGEYYDNKILGYDIDYRDEKPTIKNESEEELVWIEKL